MNKVTAQLFGPKTILWLYIFAQINWKYCLRIPSSHWTGTYKRSYIIYIHTYLCGTQLDQVPSSIVSVSHLIQNLLRNQYIIYTCIHLYLYVELIELRG